MIKERQRTNPRRLVLGTAALLLLTGCYWTDTTGTHHLVVGIGFGIITTTNRPGVEVFDSRILGGQFGPDRVGVGLMRHHSLLLDPALASNVVVSVKASPFGLTVKNFDPYSEARTYTTTTTQK
jgi:hypothetical protein